MTPKKQGRFNRLLGSWAFIPGGNEANDWRTLELLFVELDTEGGAGRASARVFEAVRPIAMDYSMAE